MRTVVVVSSSDFLEKFALFVGSQVAVEDHVDFPVLSQCLNLRSFDSVDGRSCFFGKPVDQEVFGALSAVLDLLPVAVEVESGETFDLVWALHGRVLVGIDFGKSD
mgnify:CR=1 FL=1